MRRPFPLPPSFFLLLLTLVLLAGCAGRGGSGDEIVIGPPVLGYDFGAEELILDPRRATTAASLDLVAQLFDGLTSLDASGQQVRPSLALDWAVSGDGRTYTFRMRQGVPWIDQAGEPQGEVSAADVVYTIKQACAPSLDVPARTALFIIRGCQEVAQTEGIPDLDRVGVRAIEPYVVEFVLAEPAAYFPAVLTLPVAWPLPQALLEEAGEGWSEPTRLLSNGAFRLADWQPERLILERNERYYNASATRIERVVGYRSATLEEALARYRAYEVDAVALPEGAIDLVRADPALSPELTLVPNGCTYAYGFTAIKAPVDSARVRRALSLALDRPSLAGTHYLPATTFMPVGLLPPENRIAGIARDERAAQETMAAAGYPGGQGFPPIVLMHPSGAEQTALAGAIAERWRGLLGITVELREHPAESYAQAIENTVPLPEMPHVWLMVWCARVPDPHVWLAEPLAVPRGLATFDPGTVPPPLLPPATINVGSNASRRVPSRFDELVWEAVAAPESERPALYARAEEFLLFDEAAVIPLYHRARPMLSRPWLTAPFNVPGEAHFRDWSLDMAAKGAALAESGP